MGEERPVSEAVRGTVSGPSGRSPGAAAGRAAGVRDGHGPGIPPFLGPRHRSMRCPAPRDRTAGSLMAVRGMPSPGRASIQPRLAAADEEVRASGRAPTVPSWHPRPEGLALQRIPCLPRPGPNARRAWPAPWAWQHLCRTYLACSDGAAPGSCRRGAGARLPGRPPRPPRRPPASNAT